MRTANSLSARISGNALAGYALAAFAALAALALSRALIVMQASFAVQPLPYILLMVAVAFASLYCGVGPSIAAVILGIAGIRHWFLVPVSSSFSARDLPQLIPVFVFALASAGVIVMCEARRRQVQSLRHGQMELEDRVRARTAELDTANKSLRELSARLLHIQDEERRRIARELHDSVGQLLAGLGMNLAAVRSEIERLTQAASILTDSEALVQEMSKEVRTISHLLHPPLLDEVGLSSAIRWYIEGFSQRSNIKVGLDFPDNFGRLSREAETALFRVVQECLTNIHRHSASAVASVRFRRREQQVQVEIRDEGKGVPHEKLNAMLSSAGLPGVGVRGMRERLRQLNGELELNSDSKGTVVTARLPIPEAVAVENALSTPDTSSPAAA
jgi:signal transduction histidine kinase